VEFISPKKRQNGIFGSRMYVQRGEWEMSILYDFEKKEG